MLRSKKRWVVFGKEHKLVETFVKELNISPLVANLLLNRGLHSVDEARNFLYIEKMGFHDPFLMKDMDLAVARILQAIEANEKILIFGDYDADGVSSTTVLCYTLTKLKANYDYYIPNRFTEGYGPNEPALRKAKEQGFDLVITVDTGVSAVHEASVAKELGLDFIITDHHEPPPVLPDAYCIVNPKQADCSYPFKGLAGVGVAFKLAHALLGEPPLDLLDVAVIGTIADLVPLTDENRLIAKKGIDALEKTDKPGLIALKKVCRFADDKLNAEHVGFGIGPRINAAGRLGSAKPAVQLLLSKTIEEAEPLAAEIDEVNKTRQSIVNEIASEAIDIVETNYRSNEHKVLIVAKEGWNPGVIGIVASRLVEKYYRPTIVLSINKEKGIAKGSARSIEGFDMFENLSESRDILPHFGGHPMAAGLTMNVEDVDVLRSRLNKQATQVLTDDDYIPLTKVDLPVSLKEVNLSVIEELEMLAPYGVSNPAPKILLDRVGLTQMKRIGSSENHLKMVVQQESHSLDCIGFHFGSVCDHISMASKISIVGTLAINEWNGHTKPQLMVEDIAVDEWQLFDWRGAKNIANKIEGLPKEKLCFVYFNEKTIDSLQLDKQLPLFHVNETTTTVNLSGRFVFFLDMPYEKKQIKFLLKETELPERIYTVFYQHEEHFFTTIPAREHFKWYFSFLAQKKQFDIQKHGNALAKHKGWSKYTIDFMTQVFFELEFVTINNGIIILSTNPVKRELSESKTYRRKQEQAKLENDLFYSSYHTLKEWFEKYFSLV